MHELNMDRTTAIAVAYLASTSDFPPSQLHTLISGIYETLKRLDTPTPEPEPEVLEPAVPIRKSVTRHAVTCLECGFSGKMLKRHLRNEHGLAPNEYRTRWGLAADHALTAPDYSERRRGLAKEIGLGRSAHKRGR